MDTPTFCSTLRIFGEIDTAISIALQQIDAKKLGERFGISDALVVVSHGSKNGPSPLINGQPMLVTIEKLARFISAQPDFVSQPVVLLMCWAGTGVHSHAQQLANRLGVPVIACTTMVCARTANAFVRDAAISEMVPGGTWLICWPQ
jgi:hypothetical protein